VSKDEPIGIAELDFKNMKGTEESFELKVFKGQSITGHL